MPPASVCSPRMPPPIKTTIEHKLIALAGEIESTGFANTTRLTVVKKWCQEPARLKALAVFIAKSTLANKATSMHGRERELWVHSQDLFAYADPTVDQISYAEAEALMTQLVEFQSEYRHDRWGAIRIINSKELLVIERAIGIVLEPSRPESGYKLVAEHLSSYNSTHGPGLYPECLKELYALAHFVRSIFY